MRRKFFAVILVFTGFFALGAWEMPNRYFELGGDFELGVANRSWGWGDIFSGINSHELDLDKLTGDEFSLDLLYRANLFLNVQTQGKYKIGVGIFSGIDSYLFVTLPQDTVEFLVNENNSRSFLAGSISTGGSVFADVGLRGTATINKWKFTISPSVFIPILYMTEPTISYFLSSSDPFLAQITINSDIYTAIDLNDLDNEFNAGEVLAPKGFDISADLSYQLFSFLDLGATVTHIPIVPAFMTHGRRINKSYGVNSGKSVQELLDNEELGSLLPSEADVLSFSNGNQAVTRPLRFDGYVVYTPFKDTVRLSLKPSAGLSFFTIYNKVHFNAGLETDFKLANMLGLTWDFRYREQIWLNKLGLMLNFRIVEVDLGAGFRSQDLLGAFTAKGFYASCGVRVGF
jgi:hypothetical protein